MKVFIESLRRLYESHAISKEKIVEMYNEKKINKDEMDYILN